MSLEEIILEKLNEFNFPVIFDFPAGHENENLAIPFGMKLKLEAKDEYVKLYA
jgi:muramoyltetrapeptide carboxypeptidase